MAMLPELLLEMRRVVTLGLPPPSHGAPKPLPEALERAEARELCRILAIPTLCRSDLALLKAVLL